MKEIKTGDIYTIDIGLDCLISVEVTGVKTVSFLGSKFRKIFWRQCAKCFACKGWKYERGFRKLIAD